MEVPCAPCFSQHEIWTACDNAGKTSEAGDVNYRCAAYQVALAVRPKLQTLARQMQTTP
jgi:hypothetical protein